MINEENFSGQAVGTNLVESEDAKRRRETRKFNELLRSEYLEMRKVQSSSLKGPNTVSLSRIVGRM